VKSVGTLLTSLNPLVRGRNQRPVCLFVCLFALRWILNHVFSAFLARLAFTFCPQRFSFAPCVEPASAEL
jgi:hypothetical protein